MAVRTWFRSCSRSPATRSTPQAEALVQAAANRKCACTARRHHPYRPLRRGLGPPLVDPPPRTRPRTRSRRGAPARAHPADGEVPAVPNRPTRRTGARSRRDRRSRMDEWTSTHGTPWSARSGLRRELVVMPARRNEMPSSASTSTIPPRAARLGTARVCVPDSAGRCSPGCPPPGVIIALGPGRPASSASAWWRGE
jgi:hypothetical protein